MSFISYTILNGSILIKDLLYLGEIKHIDYYEIKSDGHIHKLATELIKPIHRIPVYCDVVFKKSDEKPNPTLLFAPPDSRF